MTIYGNITFHACLELVTSQDWRHNITVNPIGFEIPKLHLAAPFEAATSSLRSPALRHRPMVNSMKTSVAQQQSIVATPSANQMK